jgi:hypothetical protein
VQQSTWDCAFIAARFLLCFSTRLRVVSSESSIRKRRTFLPVSSSASPQLLHAPPPCPLQAMGTDCWAVVPIDSSVRPGHTLEGTRLTIVSMCKPTDAGGGEEAAEEAAAGDDG